ncbi:hypothetical protein D3C87_123600 [compost metagenome]
MKNVFRTMMTALVATSFAACGGGGDGGGGGGGSSSPDVLYYPYETVYGDVCSTFQATPGCTFFSDTGRRITVTEDPDYNKYHGGSMDLWYVNFDAYGKGSVYDSRGVFQYHADVSEFAGYVGGTQIGVGTSGLNWENVSMGQYWLGKNGVLYNGVTGEGNYGQAINDKTSTEASDSNFAALNSDANKLLVTRAADKLVKEYGFSKDKAVAVASSLNSWAVSSADRGTTTSKDMDKAFRGTFGVKFSDALAAVKDLQFGDKAGMQDLTNRSAAALGIKPHQAQKFMKGMYKKALANWGYDENSVAW